MPIVGPSSPGRRRRRIVTRVTIEPPAPLRATYADWQWSLASEWADQAAWRVEAPGGSAVHFVKVTESGHFPTARHERDRLLWARAYLPVPAVIDAGSDDAVDWLVTDALAGTDATKHALLADPARLVPAFAHGLAAFHAAAPVSVCPFDFTMATALDHVRTRIRDGVAEPADLHPEYRQLTLAQALTRVEQLAPTTEDLVVCHGDYCFPNVLLDPAGMVTGYIDIGELGVADRWYDVAVAAWSVTWNVGPGWEDLFYESYGVRPEPDRIECYRLLYDLAS
jgi:kanamycin kinase